MNWFTRVSGSAQVQGGGDSRPEPVRKGFLQGLKNFFTRQPKGKDPITDISKNQMTRRDSASGNLSFKKWKPETMSSISGESISTDGSSTSSKVHSIGIFQGVYDLATKENLTGSEKEFLILKLMTIHGDSYLSSMLADSSAFDAVMGFLKKEGINDLSGIKDSPIFKNALANIKEYSDLNPKNFDSKNKLSQESILKLFSTQDNGKIQWTRYEVSYGPNDKGEIASKTQDPISNLYKMFMSVNLEKGKWRVSGRENEYLTPMVKKIFTEMSKLSPVEKKKLENDKLFQSHLKALIDSLNPNAKPLVEGFLKGEINVEVLLRRL